MIILKVLLLPLAALVEILLLLAGMALARFPVTRAFASQVIEVGQSMPEIHWYFGSGRAAND